ncbi:MucBP domain-containing protein [Enterococcus rotai]|uniref:MucBP domain-containing protein n=1 Tax=Enterococcus rotai TaxID=118060 RepID=UPI0032B47CBC
MKKTSFTLLLTLLLSVCQPSLSLAQTINNNTPDSDITNDSKEIAASSDEPTAILDTAQSDATNSTTELPESVGSDVPTTASSVEEPESREASTKAIATGTFGTSDWSIDNSGVLHIQQGTFDDTPVNSVGGYHYSPWINYRNSINKIVFEGPVVAPVIMERLFESLSNVTEIENISFLDTSNTVNMQRVFADCSSLVSLDLTSWDTSKVQDIFSLFNGCVNMETLDVSTWDTQSMTMITYAFSNMAKLKVLDLSNWKVAPLNAAQGVFMGDRSLETLDLSGFNFSQLDHKNSYATSRFFENADSLNALTVSSNFRFLNSSNGPKLPLVAANETYTGMWQNVGTGTVSNPTGTDVWTSAELMDNFDLAPKNDTYVWQPIPRVAADVSISYLDEAGDAIHQTQTISGNVGEPYDATTATYKLAIDGYTLDESKLPENGTGTLSDEAQSVVYSYTKNPVKAADVTVTYVDETGESIKTAQVISGNIGEIYDATTEVYKLAIDGYTLNESKLPENGTGILSDKAQTVIYTYTKDPVKAADVTVTYVNETGESIKTAQVISGNIGETYDATTEVYKLAIDGYTLNESKLPENGTGILSAEAQSVVYTYTKNPIKAADVTVNYVDESGEMIRASQVISGNINQPYDVSGTAYKVSIDGYTLDTSKLPANAKGLFKSQAQTVTYIYNRHKAVKDTKNSYNNQNTKNSSSQLPLAGEANKQSLMLIGVVIIVLSGIIYLIKKRRQK